MNDDDDTTQLMNRYRASAEDVATPILDRTLMEAAARQAAKRRFIRRARGAFFATALAVTAISIGWHSHVSNTTPDTSDLTDYGTIEGLTRPYLLQVGTNQYSGPGLTEGTR
jgi:hypothetical protein